MSLTRIAIVSVVVCLAASVAQADEQSRQNRRHRREARVVARHHAGVRPPVVARRYAVPTAVTPFGARLAYRQVRRPRLGVGIYIGSPYRYSYRAYGRPYYPVPNAYTYGYGSPYSQPYSPYTGIYAVPPQAALHGGVRPDVEPRHAAVYVDGYYAGIVDDFNGVFERVALEPGPHHFEIVAPGHETLAFEVHVRPNQVVRYRGDMMRIAP